jgi:hypothetical protein
VTCSWPSGAHPLRRLGRGDDVAGLALGHSGLLIRAPQQGLTFVALANTSRLTGAYDMGAADITVNGVGRLFVESIVLGGTPIPADR